MKWQRILLILTVQFGLTLPVSAGIFSRREKEKPTPAQRVPELLDILKNEPNEKKRESAAEELRQYDPKDFPEIVPALIDTLLHDAKPDVRTEAAQTLGKLRPISQEVGQALEQALTGDSAYRVRWHVRMILWSYTHNGYKPTNKLDGPSLTPPPGTAITNEPPLAQTPPAPVAPPPRPVAPTPLPAPPPAAKPVPTYLQPLPNPTGGAPTAPPSRAPDQGPELSPP